MVSILAKANTAVASGTLMRLVTGKDHHWWHGRWQKEKIEFSPFSPEKKIIVKKTH